MRQPATLLKVTAVVSSVLLAGGAIAYRAGAFDRYLESGNAQPAPTVMPSSKSKPMIDPPPTGTPDPQPSVTPVRPEIMSSSKSMILTRPSGSTTPETPPPNSVPTPSVILPSSKAASAPIITVPSPSVILPSSKATSAPIITIPPPQKPPTQQPANPQPNAPSR